MADRGGCRLPACLNRLPSPPPALTTHPALLRSAYLADAFQAHIQGNELLHEVFSFSPADEPEERLTPLEKRLFRWARGGVDAAWRQRVLNPAGC